MLLERTDYEICGCCGRSAVGLGFSLGPKQKIIWACDDPECTKFIKRTYNMKQDEFTRLESRAAVKGGEEGGQYLDHIGKTDLAQLSMEEFCEHSRRVVAGYRKALKDEMKDGIPF